MSDKKPSIAELAMAEMRAAAEANLGKERAARVAAAVAATEITVAEIMAADMPAPELVRDLLFADEVHMLVAEPNLGKTTLLVHALVDYVLGRQVLGLFNAVEPRGPVLIVTSEDRRTQLLRVLNRVLAAMFHDDKQAMEAAARKVTAALHVRDVSHLMTALHIREREEFGWLWSPFGDELAELIKARAARLVMLDPVGMFMGGEENSNDYVQRFMKDLRARIADDCHATVLGVHHVAKSIARDGTSDMHVGRGAGALAANARGMMHMMRLRARTVSLYEQTWSVPEVITDEDLRNGRVLILYQHKYNYAPPWEGPVVILRDGFAFRARWMERRSAVERKMTENLHIERAVLRFLAQQELPIGKAELLKLKAEIVDHNGVTFGRDKVVAAIERLIVAKHITTSTGARAKISIDAAVPPEALDGGF